MHKFSWNDEFWHTLDFELLSISCIRLFFIVSNFVYVFIYRSKFEPKHSPNRKKATRLKWDCECAFYCFEHEIRNMLNDFVVLVAIKKKIEWYCERCMRFKASIWLCFVPVIFFDKTWSNFLIMIVLWSSQSANWYFVLAFIQFTILFSNVNASIHKTKKLYSFTIDRISHFTFYVCMYRVHSFWL